MRKIDNGTIKCEHFDSVQEFIKYISERKENNAFRRSGRCDSKNNHEFFCGTKSWEEAQELLAKGYPEGTKKILQGSTKLTMQRGGRPRNEVAMVGGQAHVANAIIGLPKQMIRRVKQPMAQRLVSIYYDCGACARTDADDLFQGGAGVYTLVKRLEEKGVRVQLFIFNANSAKNIKQAITIKIKDFKQPINPLLVSYPLTHTSFFRRHIFRYIEVSDATDRDAFTRAYGGTLRNKIDGDYPTWLRQNNIIGKDDIYLDCESVAQCNHIESIINLANISVGHKVI